MTDINLETLVNAVRGNVLEPGDDGYDAARALWNTRFDRHPDVIVRCVDAADVAAAVRFARDRRLEISVKGGGHAFAANTVGDGGLLIDLSAMKGIDLDPASRQVRVEAGVRWKELNARTQEHGLATPGGTVSTVGVSGFTLGGGNGYLSRKYGMAIDNLLSADVVTAAGDLVRASNDENPDLFWALRGGGGNFGVVTAFEFKLHDVGPDVLAGQIFHPLEDAPELLRRYRDFMANAADEIQCYPFFLPVPPLEIFPEAFHGRLALDFVVFHARTGPDAEAALEPLVGLGDPFFSAVGAQSYSALQQAFDDGLPAGQRYDSRAHDLPALTDGAIETMMQHLPEMAGDLTVVYLGAGGGAVARIDPAATAFPHRKAPFAFHIMAGWTEPSQDDQVLTWMRQFGDAMAPHATGGVYVNILGAGEEQRIRAAYGQNYDRLEELKRRWDPENLFSRNHNIPPQS